MICSKLPKVTGIEIFLELIYAMQQTLPMGKRGLKIIAWMVSVVLITLFMNTMVVFIMDIVVLIRIRRNGLRPN